MLGIENRYAACWLIGGFTLMGTAVVCCFVIGILARIYQCKLSSYLKKHDRRLWRERGFDYTALPSVSILWDTLTVWLYRPEPGDAILDHLKTKCGRFLRMLLYTFCLVIASVLLFVLLVFTLVKLGMLHAVPLQ